MNKLLLVSLLPAAMIALGTSYAGTTTVTDGATNNFGTTGGVAIDFDSTTGITANYVPDLTAQPYSIDNISLYIAAANVGEGSPNTATVRVGVYSTLTGTGGNAGSPSTLGGFLGFSTNTVDLSTVGVNNAFTFTFSGLTVTPEANPGVGSDIRYFVFQTDNTEITDLNQSTSVAIRRIDGETGSFGDELAAILQANQVTQDFRLRPTRAPEYSATLTPAPVPAPTALRLVNYTVAVDAGQATLTWESNVGTTYKVSSSTDLIDWTEVLLDNITADTGGTTTRTVSFTAATRRFFRVEEKP